MWTVRNFWLVPRSACGALRRGPPLGPVIGLSCIASKVDNVRDRERSVEFFGRAGLLLGAAPSSLALPRRQFLRLAGAAALSSASRPVRAQSTLSDTARLVIGAPPGGMLDLAAHVLAGRLSEIWGRRVSVENKPGSNGRTALDAVAHAPPDGSTMLLAAGAPEIYRFLFSGLTFDPSADFAPVSSVGTFPIMIAVSTASPATHVKDFVAFAKRRPGSITWASPGIGTAPHLTGELFKLMSGIRMTHAPYDGMTEDFVGDLESGRVNAVFDTPGALLAPVRSHEVHGLAVTSGLRFPIEPEIPTVAESGMPGYDVSWSYGLYAPSKTPHPIVERLNTDVVLMLREQAMKEKFASLGVVAASSRPEALAAKNSEDVGLWKSVIATANVKVEQP
jgi:tripartite-type tricarboxylate transporter receptor subunit TctC